MADISETKRDTKKVIECFSLEMTSGIYPRLGYVFHVHPVYSYLFIEFELVEIQNGIDKEQYEEQSKGTVFQAMGANLYIMAIHSQLIGKVSGFDKPGYA
jgi:hypothetical protein